MLSKEINHLELNCLTLPRNNTHGQYKLKNRSLKPIKLVLVKQVAYPEPKCQRVLIPPPGVNKYLAPDTSLIPGYCLISRIYFRKIIKGIGAYPVQV